MQIISKFMTAQCESTCAYVRHRGPEPLVVGEGDSKPPPREANHLHRVLDTKTMSVNAYVAGESAIRSVFVSSPGMA
jgi:hypothetical protein